ncbi:hypothetical protein chiPu_0028171 [Chiloscyllium punctatum]|uniref:Uncharacterized protein n=1 Tax=Chiloscyllium punctatum TaxID=137246 RepID=A0A401TMW2_CHIPU|nr:hypothetical protein [Chiloscyllium punctatum]
MALSSAMPARGLHATCLVVMVLSGVHLAVTLLYYLDMHVYSGRMVRRFGSFLVVDGVGTAGGPLANSTNSSYTVEYHTPRSPPPSPLQPCPDTPPHLGKRSPRGVDGRLVFNLFLLPLLFVLVLQKTKAGHRVYRACG